MALEKSHFGLRVMEIQWEKEKEKNKRRRRKIRREEEEGKMNKEEEKRRIQVWKTCLDIYMELFGTLV